MAIRRKTISDWVVDVDTLTGTVSGAFENTSQDTAWDELTHLVVTCEYSDDTPEQASMGNPAFWFELPDPVTLAPGDTFSLPNGFSLRINQHD